MSQIIHFKESPDLGQFLSDFLRPSLIAIVYFMSAYAFARWGKQLTITDVWKEKADDPSGTHNAWRAIDIRNSNLSHYEAVELADRVNVFATYDPVRSFLKCCLVYELDPKGGHDDHFHVQVHERTVLDGGGF